MSLTEQEKLGLTLFHNLSLEEILYDSEKDCLKLRRLKEDGNH